MRLSVNVAKIAPFSQRFKAKLGGSFCDNDWDNGDDKMMMFANICEMAQFRQRLNAKHGGSRSDKRLNAGSLVKPTKRARGWGANKERVIK